MYNPYGKVRFKVKKCGNKHAACKLCKPKMYRYLKKSRGKKTPHFKGLLAVTDKVFMDTKWTSSKKENEEYLADLKALEVRKQERKNRREKKLEEVREKKLFKKLKKEEKNTSRSTEMMELRRKGYTLQEIGDSFKLTRERVRQILKGLTAKQ